MAGKKDLGVVLGGGLGLLLVAALAPKKKSAPAAPAAPPASQPAGAPRAVTSGSRPPLADCVAESPDAKRARVEAERTYQAFVEGGWGSDVGAAHALDIYLRYRGSAPGVVGLYQRRMGIPATGEWDAATAWRVAELTED